MKSRIGYPPAPPEPGIEYFQRELFAQDARISAAILLLKRCLQHRRPSKKELRRVLDWLEGRVV